VVLATHTPLTRVLPAPQAAATVVIMSFGSRTIGAGVMACAGSATDKAKPATAINLIILSSLDRPIAPNSRSGGWCGSRVMQRKLPAPAARRLEIDQGPTPRLLSDCPDLIGTLAAAPCNIDHDFR